VIGNKPQPPPDEFSGIKVVDFRKE
jgi:hypothetical protein